MIEKTDLDNIKLYRKSLYIGGIGCKIVIYRKSRQKDRNKSAINRVKAHDYRFDVSR